MFILANLYLVMLYLIVFMLGYFIYERFTGWKTIAALNVPRQAKDFIRGMFFGSITIVVELINEQLYDGYVLPLFVITAILLTFFKNYLSALYAIVIPMIYWGLKSGGSDIAIIISISLFFTILTMETIRWFNQHWFISFVPAFLVVGFISFLISSFGFGIGYHESFEQITLPYLFIILCGYIMLWFVKFSVSSRILYESTNFKFEGWYRTGLAQKAFADFVSSKKVNRAFFCVLKIDFDKKLDANQNDEIIRTYLDSVRKHLGDHNLFFAVTQDMYGFVIPYKSKITIKQSLLGNKQTRRDADDMLFELEKEIKSIPHQIMASWDEKVYVEPKIGVAMYGLETASFVNLIRDSSFALSLSTSKNTIALYDFKELTKAKRNNKQISQMDKNIVLDDFALYFTPLIDIKKKSTALTYANIKNVADYDYYETVNDIVYSKGWETTFNRYYAAEALKKAEGKKVGFDYSLTIFENEFDYDHFVSFVEQTGNKLSNLFLFIPKESVAKVKNFTKVKQEIERISEVNFVIDHDADERKVKRIFKDVKYIYRHFGLESSKYPEAKVISFDIQTEHDVKRAIKNNVAILGGELFENKIIFTKFDKQSKIYLESIMKGRK